MSVSAGRVAASPASPAVYGVRSRKWRRLRASSGGSDSIRSSFTRARLVRSRGRARYLVVIGAVALAGCGETTLDAGDIENEITPQVEEQTGTKDVAIDCP